MRNELVTEKEWDEFWREGFVRIGKVANEKDLAEMQQRLDDIMLGKADLDYDKIMMQLDREPGRNAPGPQSRGHKGATLLYRKMQNLEFDPIFLRYLQRPIFRDVCEKIYGKDQSVKCFRAMFMNKPAGEGTYLVWHQDRWTNLDRDPIITIYTAIDPATIENGCVHLIPRSHDALINPSHGSGFLTEQQIEEIVAKHDPFPLEMEAGEVVLLHNWTLHSSGTNRTDQSRRAFSVCYMDGETIGGNFTTVFGDGELSIDQLAVSQ